MNVPKLRFKDDDGREYPEREEKELGDVIELMQSGVSRLLNDSDIGLPVIRSTNLINGKLNISDLKYWYAVDNQGVNLENYFLKESDLLVNFINSLAQIGKVALYEDLLKRNTIFTTNIMRLSFKKVVNYRFIFCFFQTNDYEQHIQAITKPAVNQASFTTKEFKTLKVPFPSLPEQTKIANFLTAIDEKITQLTQKYDLLVQYKKGVMQQIFSQKLRFREDDGREFPEWEKRKIGELGRFIGGGTPTTQNEDFWNGNIPWISSSDLSDESIFQIKTTRFISEKAISQSATKLVPKNSILIVSRVGVGKVAIAKEDICTSQDFTNLVLHSGNQVFFAYLLKTKTNKLLEFNQGTSIKGFVKSDLEAFEISTPVIQEQTKIANFITAIDNKIAHTKTQLDAVKLYKKGLLQQLFV